MTQPHNQEHRNGQIKALQAQLEDRRRQLDSVREHLKWAMKDLGKAEKEKEEAEEALKVAMGSVMDEVVSFDESVFGQTSFYRSDAMPQSASSPEYSPDRWSFMDVTDRRRS